MATDTMLTATKEWLKEVYGKNPLFTIDLDATTEKNERAMTIKALIQALQIEIGVTADGVWGALTTAYFATLFPDGLGENTEISNTVVLNHIVHILQGGFYTSRGIAPGGLDGKFGAGLTDAVKKFQAQVGIEQNGVVREYLMKSILTTDSYTKDSTKGDENIVSIQKQINNKYCNILGIIPTNGVYSKATNKALISILQHELGLTVDGIWGNNTMEALPTLKRYGTITNKQIVYVLQYCLYINGFDPNGFDGGFGAGVQSAVKKFQAFVNLNSDGICGKQTWASLLVSYGDKNRAATACDCITEITEARAKTLKEAGYKTVGRYLTNAGEKKLNKKIQEGEIKTILNAGLTVFPIYQTTGNYAEYFHKGRGNADAEYAYKAAKKYGFKRGTTIYFGVDFDALGDDITGNIIPYFKGVKEKMTEFDNFYKIGIYGPRGVCKATKDQELTESSFVCDMSSGFSANIGNILPRDWAYDQIATITLGSGEGEIQIDKNVSNTIGSDEFDKPEEVCKYLDDVLVVKKEDSDAIIKKATELLEGMLNSIQVAKAVRKPRDTANILMHNDITITEISQKYKVRKALIQTVFMWEGSCEGIDDVASDTAVQEYYDYKNELEKWENLSDEEKQNVKKPTEPTIIRKDSSTGFCQIFASTAINAYNYAIKRGYIVGETYDKTDWHTVFNVWNKLHTDVEYTIEMAALVLLHAADLVKISDITYEYSADDVKKVLARYNGTNDKAQEYGERNYQIYDLFEGYNKKFREEA